MPRTRVASGEEMREPRKDSGLSILQGRVDKFERMRGESRRTPRFLTRAANWSTMSLMKLEQTRVRASWGMTGEGGDKIMSYPEATHVPSLYNRTQLCWEP